MKVGWKSMRFLGYGILGIMAGGLIGLVGGFLLVQFLMAFFPPDNCREGACGIAAIMLTFYSMLISAGLGFLIGLWQAWRSYKRAATPSS